MVEKKQNYYGSLCTEMYEILHEQAPQDELDFYLSYAEKGEKILEPLCGSGRFLVPFLKRGFDVSGMDLSEEGYDLILKGKNHYDEKSQTQFSPSIYELYNGAELLQSENMDFQTHLYCYGEMEDYLKECGFKSIATYFNYQKEPAVNDKCEMFIYECSV